MSTTPIRLSPSADEEKLRRVRRERAMAEYPERFARFREQLRYLTHEAPRRIEELRDEAESLEVADRQDQASLDQASLRFSRAEQDLGSAETAAQRAESELRETISRTDIATADKVAQIRKRVAQLLAEAQALSDRAFAFELSSELAMQARDVVSSARAKADRERGQLEAIRLHIVNTKAERHTRLEQIAAAREAIGDPIAQRIELENTERQWCEDKGIAYQLPDIH